MAQVALLLGLLLIVWFFSSNAAVNLQDRHLGFGFSFLSSSASFNLGDNVVGYVAGDSFLWAIAAGVVNTLLVSIFSIAAATVIGLIIAMARLSGNLLAVGLSRLYIEFFRNIPLLLQIIFWYALLTAAGPSPRNAWDLFDAIFISNRGLAVPTFVNAVDYLWIAILVIVCVSSIFLIKRRVRRVTGAASVLVIILGVGSITLMLNNLGISVPSQKGFGFSGGTTISPEFIGLALGLTIYTSAFIAEIIRGGILGVDRGQQEAADSLGISEWHTLRYVILPQAARIVIPPLGSEYLSLVKNSSLAVAIGYADIVRVGSVIIAGTGRTIETITLIMGIYLFISLSISAAINLYYRSIMAKGV